MSRVEPATTRTATSSEQRTLPRRAYDLYREVGARRVLAAGLEQALTALPYTEPIRAKAHEHVHHRAGAHHGQNPILTADAVDDYGRCQYLADPFFLATDEAWHLFVEVYNPNRDPDAVISHAISTDRGDSWSYTGVVLDPGHHVSFPYVFEHAGAYHMIIESGGRGGTPRTVDRYEATAFPHEWHRAETLCTVERNGGDTVAFEWDGRWWLAGGDSTAGLHLHSSERLVDGEWQPHPDNPVVDRGRLASRPGGRPVVCPDRILFFFQDCVRTYGAAVRAYEITTLTPTAYEDRPVATAPVLDGQGRRGWRSGRMHHVDAQLVDGEWVVIADGDSAGGTLFGSRWSIGLLEGFDKPVLPSPASVRSPR